VEYQIDLTEENANSLRDSLAGFVEAARRDWRPEQARNGWIEATGH
jgi:hypothetical protein